MLTKEMIAEANQKIDTIPVKGKQYAMVKDRIKVFREVCPGGAIIPELISLADGTAVFKVTILDDEGSTVATAHASEREGSSQVNSTSWLENAETSAVGRALGFAGFGIDGSMASADEVANAIIQQEGDKRPATDVEKKIFQDYCRRLGQDPKKILAQTGWKTGTKMTSEQHGRALVILMEIENAKKEEENG